MFNKKFVLLLIIIILIFLLSTCQYFELLSYKEWLKTSGNDEVEVYGQRWQRKKILSVLVLHQVHHRGQMTALMRVLGLKVPGIYGHAKEEWSQYGMPVME